MLFLLLLLLILLRQLLLLLLQPLHWPRRWLLLLARPLHWQRRHWLRHWQWQRLRRRRLVDVVLRQILLQRLLRLQLRLLLLWLLEQRRLLHWNVLLPLWHILPPLRQLFTIFIFFCLDSKKGSSNISITLEKNDDFEMILENIVRRDKKRRLT